MALDLVAKGDVELASCIVPLERISQQPLRRTQTVGSDPSKERKRNKNRDSSREWIILIRGRWPSLRGAGYIPQQFKLRQTLPYQFTIGQWKPRTVQTEHRPAVEWNKERSQFRRHRNPGKSFRRFYLALCMLSGGVDQIYTALFLDNETEAVLS